jgi:hypothetical protein
VNATLAPGTSGTLVLAEAAGGWSATLDGKPLARLAAPVDGWEQGFTLPAGGGHLVITRNETARNLSLGAEAAALLVVFVLALPGSRSSVPVPAAADAESVPTAGRRAARARGAKEPRARGTREQSAREDSAEGAQPARRKRRPLPALAGVTAGRGARGQDSDETAAGDPVAAGAMPADPFGTHDDPGYGGTDLGHGGTDPGYGGTDPGHGAPGFAPRPGRQAPARAPEPALGVTPDLDTDPAPWEGLASQITQTPALRDRPDPAPAAPSVPAAPRRGRGAHAARHGKPSRRSRGEG